MKRLITAILIAMFLTVPAFATDLTGKSWKVYNIDAASGVKWDINKAQAIGGGTGVFFNFQPYENSTTSGWFSVYLLTNFNGDITGKTITADISVGVTPPGTQFFTRSTACENTGDDAYVRLEFQTVASGPYQPSDYWWSTGSNSFNLSTIANGGVETLSFSTSNPALWSNINGQTGDVVPSEFANAVKHVKQVGLAFGSPCRYASGVTVDAGSGRFELISFTVE